MTLKRQMAEGKATTIRFSNAMYERLEEAGQLTGLPLNSIVVVACLEWLDAHQPFQSAVQVSPWPGLPLAPMQRHWKAPSWRRAVYPFDRFTERAKHALTLAQEDAISTGSGSIEPEHLLGALAADPSALAGRALGSLGLEAAAKAIRPEAVPPAEGSAASRGAALPTESTRGVIEAAFLQAKEAGDAYVGTAHLLLALLDQLPSRMSDLLASRRATRDQLKSVLLELKRDKPELG
jgi:hypothetical protein